MLINVNCFWDYGQCTLSFSMISPGLTGLRKIDITNNIMVRFCGLNYW